MDEDKTIEMLHHIAKTIAGFDGQIRGLLLINDYIQEIKKENINENDTN